MNNSKSQNYPISRVKNSKWVFVKNISGTYDQALTEAARLQINNKTGWKYAIWDNR